MLHQRPMMRGYRGEWAGLVLALVAAAVLGTLAAARVSVTSLERPRPAPETRDASLARQLAALDAAIAAKDRSGAIYAWRDAYGLAVGAREWEALVRVGDAALKIDALTRIPESHPTGFRAEARQAYLLALFRARDASAPEGVARVAEAFDALGDVEMAARARTIVLRAVP
jgi:hypothetical protein